MRFQISYEAADNVFSAWDIFRGAIDARFAGNGGNVREPLPVALGRPTFRRRTPMAEPFSGEHILGAEAKRVLIDVPAA
jgi:hypothetical protein